MFTYLDPEAHQMYTNLKINTETNTVIKFSAHFTGTGPSPANKITEDRPPVFGLGYLEFYYWPISSPFMKCKFMEKWKILYLMMLEFLIGYRAALH